MRFYIALCALLFAACSAEEPETSTAKQKGDALLDQELTVSVPTETESSARCPVYESRQWHGWIDQVRENSQKTGKEGRLVLKGKVDAPTPGYRYSWKAGPMDRRFPPALTINLSFHAPEGVLIQVITPMDVSMTLPTQIMHYREINIVCGGQKIATLPDVMVNE